VALSQWDCELNIEFRLIRTLWPSLGIDFFLEFRISTPSGSSRELDPEGQK